jgi:hypothetical protein
MSTKQSPLFTSLSVFLAVLLLTNCSSVPFTTMIKLSTFNEQSLTQMTAEEIKARITVNEFLNINLAETKLAMSVESDTGELMLNFPLELIAVFKNIEEKKFFSTTPASQTYLLKLSPDAILDFKKLKQQLTNSTENKFGFAINAKLKKQENLNASQLTQQLFMTIELKLGHEEDFFTLIDNVELEDGKTDL